MSTCASCGATARATATFCHVCGRRLDLLPSSERGDDAPPASRRSGAELLGLALGSYSVLLVANLGLLLGHIGLASLRWIECTMLVAAIAAMQLASGRGAVPSLKAFLTAPKLRPRLLGVIVAAVAAALAAA